MYVLEMFSIFEVHSCLLRPVDILTTIKEFQSQLIFRSHLIYTEDLIERKTKKSTLNDETFQSQKSSLYARSRQEVNDVVREGNAYL